MPGVPELIPEVKYYYQEEENKSLINEEIEKLRIENRGLQNSNNESERKLAEWNEISVGKPSKFIRDFLQEKGFYNEIHTNEKIQTQYEDMTEVFYFSSVNRDGDLGIFQNENKTFTKEAVSLYKFEVKKSNRDKAEFWFDASSSMAVASALSSPYYKIEPVCTIEFPFREGNTRIISTGNGTAKLENDGRWIVTQKAKIRYE